MRFFIVLLFSTLAIATLGKPVQISDQEVDGEADDSEYEYAEEETALHSNKKDISRNTAESEIDSRRLEANEEPIFNVDTKEREEKSFEPTESEEPQNLPEEQARNERGEIDMNNFSMSTVKSDVENEKENYINKQEMKSKRQEYLFDRSCANEDPERRPGRDINRNYKKRQSQHYNNQYYEKANSQRSRYVRGRRDAETPNQDKVTVADNGKLDDEEAAIRRHVKKLSKDELEEFLNSLTDDKRLLLKKIMDNGQSDEDSIIKREITKKEGAALEMNGFNDNNQAEMKPLNIAANAEATLSSTAVPANAAAEAKDSKSETPNVVTTKVDTENTETSGLSNDKTGISIELESNLQPGAPQVTTKVDIKRETKNDEQEEEAPKSDNDSGDRSLDNRQPEGDHIENLENQDETDGTYNSDAELEDSIKSLEESFPNPISYGESSWTENNLEPHLRFKRTEADTKYPKCEHVPYRAENEDEDSDESSEFEDDDRTSNIAKGVDKPDREKEDNANEKLENTSETEAPKLEKDNGLGSDSDGVLSGDEGVNENIMLAREKRSDDEDVEERGDNLEGNNLRSNSLKDKSRNNFGGAPIYQENDAFGPLPRNYEGESGRFKRVRLAKAAEHNQDK